MFFAATAFAQQSTQEFNPAPCASDQMQTAPAAAGTLRQTRNRNTTTSAGQPNASSVSGSTSGMTPGTT